MEKQVDTRQNIYDTYHLSTEGYFFRYREDKYDKSLLRATLYNIRTYEIVDDVLVWK